MFGRQPKVTLVSWTMMPLETVYAIWQSSKTTGPLMSTQEVHEKVSRAELQNMFKAVIAQRIPIGEHIDFVFMLENISVSWREQAVRHRIGTRPSPERLGADIVMADFPNLPDSSWWSQSMRIQDMSRFADTQEYRVPVSIGEDAGALDVYRSTMLSIQEAYRALLNLGIPMEDARELMPLGAQHRMSWKLNCGSLQHIVGERGCWILQLGTWGPIIEGMINELVAKVDPVFSELVTPPCIKGDKFGGCVYMEECRRRLSGDDKLPPCPLHLTHHTKLDPATVPMTDEMAKRAGSYRAFWGRNPYTGEKL